MQICHKNKFKLKQKYLLILKIKIWLSKLKDNFNQCIK